jgi:hypothetical protein
MEGQICILHLNSKNIQSVRRNLTERIQYNLVNFVTLKFHEFRDFR